MVAESRKWRRELVPDEVPAVPCPWGKRWAAINYGEVINSCLKAST